MKRMITLQDISCVGKCSLTAAIPILSALGVESAAIPTALLSNHTAFDSFTFLDLTSQIMPIAQQLKRHHITFDAIYTGYLGSLEQIGIVGDFIDLFSTPQNMIFVDPAMGDLGRLYTGFDLTFAKAMAGLCRKADLVVPNITEAAFMLDMPYYESGYSPQYIEQLLDGLLQLGAKGAVLTGVSFSDSEIGVAARDRASQETFIYQTAKIPASYHGTGDIFASVCVGAITRGLPLKEALRLAVDYTSECIRLTQQDPKAEWYGVNFEQAFGWLADRQRELGLLQ